MPANVSDQEFRKVVDWQEERTIALGDSGFRVRADEDDGVPINICARGVWNCRVLIETVLSVLERVFQIKNLTHRMERGMDMRLRFRGNVF